MMFNLWFTKLENPLQIEKGTIVKEQVNLSVTWCWKNRNFQVGDQLDGVAALNCP
jgi:hypothetical protein